MRLPFFFDAGFGRRSRMSSFESAATRFRRQIATGCSSTRPRRHAGSHGRSQVRPSTPGNTLDCQLIMYASEYFPSAIRRMYSGTGVWAGHAHWQSTTRWKYSGAPIDVGSTPSLPFCDETSVPLRVLSRRAALYRNPNRIGPRLEDKLMLDPLI